MVIKQIVTTKSKAAWQTHLPIQKSNSYCVYSHRSPKNKKSRNQKNSQAKKKNHSSAANNTSSNKDQSSQTLGRSSKKEFCLNGQDQQGQFFHIQETGSNATIIKKDKKQGNKNLSQVRYYSYYKKSHYIGKCSDKEPRNKF